LAVLGIVLLSVAVVVLVNRPGDRLGAVPSRKRKRLRTRVVSSSRRRFQKLLGAAWTAR